MDRKDLQNLSRVRLKEAKALLDLELFDGAYYLAGYAVECAIKACIAKATKRWEFPEKKRVDLSHTHNLKELLKVAGLFDETSTRANNDPDFDKNWETVKTWSEQSRYRRNRAESAREILNAVTDKHHGVIAWLKLHW